MDTEWMARACCKGVSPAVFFPTHGEGVDAAVEICRRCRVRDLCLEYALVNRVDHGVWGGASERERGRILRERRARARATAPAPPRVGGRDSPAPSARAS
jgi:WhiB family redox-sensing transcriptional regulator